MRRLIFIICLTVPVLGFALEDEATSPIGTENYHIITLGSAPDKAPWIIDTVKAIDMNDDNLPDIMVTLREKTSAKSSVAIFWHRPTAGDAPPFGASPDQMLTLDEHACLIGAGDYSESKGKEIIVISPEGLSYYKLANPYNYDPAINSLLQTPTLFRYPISPEARQGVVPFSPALSGADFNGDGYDNPIIPMPDGYSLLVGKSTAPLHLPIAPLPATLSANPADFVTMTSALPNIMLEDINGDGVKDIVAYGNNEISYYLMSPDSNGQFRNGRFSTKFLASQISSDEISFYALHFADLNRDKIADIIITSTGGDIDQKLMTRIFVFLGGPDKSGIPCYPETPSQIINIKGISPSLRLANINNDSFPDLFLTSFEMNFGSNIQKALLRYIAINYQVYFFQPTQVGFSKSPNYEQSINFPINSIGRGAFSHILMEYDFNRDGINDLLTFSGPNRKTGLLAICPGIPAQELIRKNSIGFRKDEYLLYPTRVPDRVIVEELNNDQKRDIILQYKSSLIVMVSR